VRVTIEVVWTRPSAGQVSAAALNAAERERAHRLLQEADRARFVAAHALLRTVLASWTGLAPAELAFDARCRVCGGRHGKPTLTDGPHFSLSYAGDRVVVAVTSIGPVGVDVEDHAAVRFDGFDSVVLASAERAPVGAAARATVWVRKEAILKATGHGLAFDPSRVEVTAPDGPARLVAWHADDPPAGPMQLTDLSAGAGYSACVAVMADSPVAVKVTDGNDLLAD
jgi:4'-phosphopantetheinyl transferase